ncbi:acylphosphatase [Gimesia panareensis]|uniref:acylphosphatase n=1 Tax=Gimesia panareensis TaxID=2527978 RepID=A0A518A9V2_9PLAN|nr:acylphosphatase [Gimesia panareensis]QDT28652.1 Acylphosphatase [Gimesia panareensis]QDU51506.1 Acylphosphatase [Gimesia panareensis]
MCAEPHQSDSSADQIGLRAIYEGRVQGVGFRYRTSQLAQRYPITGFVKNLADGTVELVAQAREQTVLDRFFDDMMLTFATNVTDVSIQGIPADPGRQEFTIEY